MKPKDTILILGAGSDMAKAIARLFAAKGYKIQLAGRRPEQMERLRKDLISRYGATVYTCQFDAIDYENHSAFVSSLPEIPSIVIYTAGYMTEQDTAQKHWKETKNMIEVNYSGAVSILNIFARIFNDRQYGCIIGVSSVAGERGRRSNYIYGSTKAAFTAYLSGLRSELYPKKIQVLTVKPGFVYTKMTHHLALPKRLTATPEKVAATVYSAVEKGKSVVYVKPVWRGIMAIIKGLPESLFKRLNL